MAVCCGRGATHDKHNANDCLGRAGTQEQAGAQAFWGLATQLQRSLAIVCVGDNDDAHLA